MFIIYNLSGFLLGVAGVALGVIGMLATGWMSLGPLLPAVLWLWLGGRRVDPDSGRKWAPSVFFIPLRWLGVLLLVSALPLLLVDVVLQRRGLNPKNLPPDVRIEMLKADEKVLRSQKLGGDIELSRDIYEFLNENASEAAKADEIHVFTRVKADKVLVLVQMPNLKQFADSARSELLDVIELALLISHPQKKPYIGVKGGVVYGAMKTPSKGVQSGRVLLQGPLLAFYGDMATTAPATAPTSSPTTVPATSPTTRARPEPDSED